MIYEAAASNCSISFLRTEYRVERGQRRFKDIRVLRASHARTIAALSRRLLTHLVKFLHNLFLSSFHLVEKETRSARATRG